MTIILPKETVSRIETLLPLLANCKKPDGSFSHELLCFGDLIYVALSQVHSSIKVAELINPNK